jgi:hypothetical protein
MAKFPIIRAGGTLPGIAPAARADIDVRTGARELAEGISALGEAVQKYELMQASTQLSEFKRKVREEHNRLALSYDGNLDPTTFKSEYEKSLQVRRGLIPKNRFAAQEARLWLNDRMPVWEMGVEKSRQLRIEKNFSDEGAFLEVEAVRTGDFTKYFQHLEVGRRPPLNFYGKGEVAKRKQNIIESRERFIRAEEAKRKVDAKEQRAQYVEQVEQDFLIKLRDTSLSENDVMDSDLDVDEKREWLGYIEKQRERILSGADIITDQSRKHELLDMAAAINWPERQVTAQEVNKLAREGRYGAPANLDDIAYDEIRDAIRSAEKDKIPFTQKFIETIIGELITGAPSSVLGLPLPTLRTREDSIRHATNAFGRFVSRIPGVMDTINAKFPPEKRESTPEEPKGTPAYDFDGELIGGYNPNGSITLNSEGVRRLYELAGRDMKKTRQMAEQNRYIIPNIKE